MTVGFIGAGKCGLSLAYYFRSKGIDVFGFSSRSENTKDFDFFGCGELLAESNVVFITVPDRTIPEIWDKIRHMDLNNKIICHCSGSVSSKIFAGANPDMVCSVHPMLAFNSTHTPSDSVSKACFTVEGGENAVSVISEILSLCGNKFKVITSENKIKYHAAACFASNFVVSVCRRAQTLLEECGFEGEEAMQFLAPLMICNMKNITDFGCCKAITGPAARGDFVTIERHRNVLNEKDRRLYDGLTDVIFKMRGEYE